MRVYYNDNNKDVCLWLEQLIKNGDITRGDVDDRSIEEITPDDITGYDRVHLFAGIGTWDYALNQAGWGDMPVWTASLPCQPFSSAGKQLGRKDERHLLPTYLELVRKCKPKIQFGEQVASSEVVGTELEASFVIAVQNGDYAKANKITKRLVAQRGFTFTSRWVDDLHAEMEKAGYTVGYGVLGAHSVNAAHIRQRLYWVAHTECNRYKPQQNKKSSEIFRTPLQQVEQWKQSSNICSTSCVRLGNTEQQGLERHSGDEISVGKQRWDNEESDRSVAEASCNDRMEHTKSDRFGQVGHGNAGQVQREDRKTESEIGLIYGIEWLYCRDNKYRPVKSGIKPLVDGTAKRVVHSSDTGAQIEADNTQEARTMRLKGYGNAIQAQTATAFIRAFYNHNRGA